MSMDASTKTIRRGFGAIAVLTAVCASSAPADSIQLRSRATVAESTVHLADLAALEGESVAALAAIIVAKLDPSQASLTLSQDELKQVLTKAGVNWARVSLKGFDICRITREAKTGEKDAASPAAAAPTPNIDAPRSPILSNPIDEVGAEAQFTVRQRIVQWLRQLHGASGGALRITFSDRDAKSLDSLVTQDRLVLTSGVTSNLGRVPVTIQRFRGEKLVDTQRLSVDVAQRYLAVVAARPINKGATVSFEDVEVREVFLDRDAADVVTAVDDAIGQVAAVSLREKAVLSKDNIRPAFLVRRNDLIRVQAIAGGLMVQTFARALEDGGEGQVIQARNERSRDSFAVRVIGTRRALLLVDDAAGGESKPKEKAAENKDSTAVNPGSK